VVHEKKWTIRSTHSVGQNGTKIIVLLFPIYHHTRNFILSIITQTLFHEKNGNFVTYLAVQTKNKETDKQSGVENIATARFVAEITAHRCT